MILINTCFGLVVLVSTCVPAGVNGTNVMRFFDFQTTQGNYDPWTSVWILLLNLFCAAAFMYYSMGE